jgi:hypothetical protein
MVSFVPFVPSFPTSFVPLYFTDDRIELGRWSSGVVIVVRSLLYHSRGIQEIKVVLMKYDMDGTIK